MPEYKVNEKLNTDIEEGIWVDYEDHTWYFFIKDDIWNKEEVQRAQKGKVKLQFIQKDTVDAFLLDIYDCLETSDIPFCIKEADPAVIEELKDSKGYHIVITGVAMDNTIQVVRKVELSKENSTILKLALKQRLNSSYDADDFDKDYEKIILSYEPYELEQFALFEEEFS